MKTSVVFFVGVFLFGCVGAKPQNVLNNVRKHISDTTAIVREFDINIFKTFWDYIFNLLPLDETKEYCQQLINSPVWKAVTDLTNGKDLQKIVERIKESEAYKMLADYYDKLYEGYEQASNTMASHAIKIRPF